MLVSVATKNAFPDAADKSIEKRVRKWFANKLKKSGWQKKSKSKEVKCVINDMPPSSRGGASNADATDSDSSSTD